MIYGSSNNIDYDHNEQAFTKTRRHYTYKRERPKVRKGLNNKAKRREKKKIEEFREKNEILQSIYDTFFG